MMKSITFLTITHEKDLQSKLLYDVAKLMSWGVEIRELSMSNDFGYFKTICCEVSYIPTTRIGVLMGHVYDHVRAPSYQIAFSSGIGGQYEIEDLWRQILYLEKGIR